MSNETKTPEIDHAVLDYNLSIEPSKRLEIHQANFETVQELKKAHKKLYAKPESTLKDTSRSQN